MASGKLSKPTARPATASRQKDPSQPSTLSAEFVEDSSDEEAESSKEAAAIRSSTAKSSVLRNPLPNNAGKSEVEENGEDEDDEAHTDSRAGAASQEGGPSRANKEASRSKSNKSTPSGRNMKAAGKQLHQEAEASESEDEANSEHDSTSSGEEDGKSGAQRDAVNQSGYLLIPIPQALFADLGDRDPSIRSIVTNRTTFRPPKGFDSVLVPQEYATKSLISPESLAGKKLWHIIAPSDVPISSITAATVVRQQLGGSRTEHVDIDQIVSSHKGFDYSFLEDESQDSPCWAYIPKAGGGTFSPAGLKISRTVRLRNNSSAANRSQTLPIAQTQMPAPRSARPAPQQPQGLTMRYHPFGVVTQDHLSRNNPSSRPERHASPPRAQSPGKRKAPPSTDGELLENSSNKSKKHKRAKRDTQESHVNGLGSDASRPPLPKHDGETDQLHSDIDSTSNVQPIGETTKVDAAALRENENETPEERAKRKAEKKRRKEEKLARKAERRAKREAATEPS
jgi:DNA-directed RNA polymerase I subunit RPA34.5